MAKKDKTKKTPEQLKQDKARKTGFQIGKSISEFGRAGLQQPPDLSFEQDVMEQVMGGGKRGSIWGANDSVRINHDLNPRMRGDFGTAEIFGMA